MRFVSLYSVLQIELITIVQIIEIHQISDSKVTYLSMAMCYDMMSIMGMLYLIVQLLHFYPVDTYMVQIQTKW